MRRSLPCELVVLAVAAGCAASVAPEYPGSKEQSAGRRIALVGDLQRTTPVEAHYLGREQNDAERRRIAGALAREAPESLVLLGDMVSNGDSSDEWAGFDALMLPVVEGGSRFFPVLGNHDYWDWAAQARWFEESIGGFEADPAIRAIAVLAHHPARARLRAVRGRW